MAEPREERPGQSGQGAARRTAPAKAGPSASRWRSLGPAVPGLLFLAIVFLLPVFGVFLRGVTDPVFGLQNYAELLGSGTFYDILGNTFLVAILVTIFSILLGFPVAWLITIAPGRIAKLVLAVVLLSMWTGLHRGLDRALVGYRVGLALCSAATVYCTAVITTGALV